MARYVIISILALRLNKNKILLYWLSECSVLFYNSLYVSCNYLLFLSFILYLKKVFCQSIGCVITFGYTIPLHLPVLLHFVKLHHTTQHLFFLSYVSQLYVFVIFFVLLPTKDVHFLFIPYKMFSFLPFRVHILRRIRSFVLNGFSALPA